MKRIHGKICIFLVVCFIIIIFVVITNLKEKAIGNECINVIVWEAISEDLDSKKELEGFLAKWDIGNGEFNIEKTSVLNKKNQIATNTDLGILMWNGEKNFLISKSQISNFEKKDTETNLYNSNNTKERNYALYNDNCQIEIYSDLSCILTRNNKKTVFNDIDLTFTIDEISISDIQSLRFLTCINENERILIPCIYWKNNSSDLSNALLRYMILDENSKTVTWTATKEISSEYLKYLFFDSNIRCINNKIYFSTGKEIAYLDLQDYSIVVLNIIDHKFKEILPDASLKKWNEKIIPIELVGNTKDVLIVCMTFESPTNEEIDIYCAIKDKKVYGILECSENKNGSFELKTYSANMKNINTYHLEKKEIFRIMFQNLEYSGI